jgi:hypothetical protein
MTNRERVSRSELPGVWKRIMLVDELGTEDLESQVYWIQSATLCGDIRKHLRQSTLADLSLNGGAPMVDAFAGELIETDAAFRWEPLLSYRDQDRLPDEGRLSWVGDDLLEEGVHRAYLERWARVATAAEHDFALALRRPEDDCQGWVLRIGRFLFVARQTARSSAGAPDEFSLFEMLPEGPHLVLSTVATNRATCPRVEFADAERRTVRLSHWAERASGVGELWHIAAIEGAAHAIGDGFASPLVTERER